MSLLHTRYHINGEKYSVISPFTQLETREDILHATSKSERNNESVLLYPLSA